jgi:hypothetical protein
VIGGGRVALELVAEPPHRGVDGATLGEWGVAPDLHEQLGPRDVLALALPEVAQEAALPGGERDDLVPPLGPLVGQIDRTRESTTCSPLWGRFGPRGADMVRKLAPRVSAEKNNCVVGDRMAYDTVLADRIRDLLVNEKNVTEKRCSAGSRSS